MLDRFAVNDAAGSGRVLVTGSGGCIGAWTLALLVRAGVDVTAFDLDPAPRRPALLMTPDELDRVTWVAGDIADPEAVRAAAAGCEAVIHLAALQVPFCKADPIGGARVNVVGTANVFEAARHEGIRRVGYASSIAAHSFFPDSPYLKTLYGAYKTCGEQTAAVYWQDWQVPSVGLRPSVVQGVGRDQGVTSKTTVAIQAAALGVPYTVPFRGPVSFLHAGEVASAFIRTAARDGDGAPVFDISGPATTVEAIVDQVRTLAPDSEIAIDGDPLPFPADLSDAPVRAHLGDYGTVDPAEGVAGTFQAFRALAEEGRMVASDIR